MDLIEVVNSLLSLSSEIIKTLKPIDPQTSNTIAQSINAIRAETGKLRDTAVKSVLGKSTSERDAELRAMVKGK